MKVKICILLFFCFLVTGWSQSIIQEEQDFEFANRLAQKGMFDMAAVQFNRFAEGHPMSLRAPEALMNAGMNYVKADSLNRAIQVLSKLLFRYPDSKIIDQAQFNYGTLLNRSGEIQKAAVIWSRLYLFSPQSDLIPAAQVNAATAFLKIKDYRSAADAISVLLEKYPTHPSRFEARYLLAKVKSAQHQYDEALRVLDQMTGDTVDDQTAINIRLLRAHVLQQVGRYSKADSLLESIVRSGQKNDSVFTAAQRASRSLFLKGNYIASNEMIQTAMALNPAAPLAIPLSIQKADNHFASAQYAEASQALSTIPDGSLTAQQFMMVEYRNGAIQKKMQKENEALSHFQNILNRPDTSMAGAKIKHHALIECAGLLCELDRAFEALQLLQGQIRKTPVNNSDAEILFTLGSIQENYLHDLSGARYHYSSVLSIAPGSSFSDDAQAGIARTFEKQNNYSSALQEYQRFQNLFPGADQAAGVAQRIAYIQKFLPLQSENAGQLFSLFLLNQIKGTAKSDLMADWIQKQINVFHDYKGALAFLKIASADSNGSVMSEEQLLYLASYCHALLAEKYFQDGNAQKYTAHCDSMTTDLSSLRNTSPLSPQLMKIRYLAARLKLLTAAGAEKLNILQQAMDELYQTAGNDSLIGQLKFQIAEILYADAGKSGNDTTIQNLHASFKAILASPVPNELKAKTLYLQGSLYQDQGIPDSAAVVLQSIVTSHPNSAEIVKTVYALAQIHEQLGLYNEAKRLYSRILDQYYYSSLVKSAQKKIWTLAIQAGKTDDVLQQIDRERDARLPHELWLYISSVESDETLWFYAQAHIKANRSMEALTALKNYVTVNQNGFYRARAFFTAAGIADQLNEMDVAMGFYKELIESMPADSLADIAEVRCADLYFERGNFNNALELYRSVQKKIQGTALITAGAKEIICLYKLGQIAKATQMAEQFLKANPSDKDWEGEFLYEEGTYYLGQKDFKSAEKSYKTLQKKYDGRPLGARGELGLARMYVILNNTDEALKILTKIPERFQDAEMVATAYLNLGDFYYENRQIENTIAACSKVLELQDRGPLRAAAMDILINAYDDYGMRDRALALEREYLRLYPNDPSMLERRIRIGIFLYNLKEYDRAIAQLREVKPLVNKEDDPRVQYWIAKCYADDGNREQAIIEFLKVKYLSKPTKLPFGPTALYEAALEYRKLGNYAKARELLLDVVKERGTGDTIGQAANMKIREIDEEQRIARP